MCVDKWILTLGVLTIGILGRAEAYTNQWAAHIDGGPRIARQVAEDHGFTYHDEVAGKLRFAWETWPYVRITSNKMINSNITNHESPLFDDRISSKQSNEHAKTSDKFTKVIEFSMLSTIKRKPGGYKPQFFQKFSSLFYRTPMASLKFQSFRYDSTKISFTSRRFSNFSNILGKSKLYDKIFSNVTDKRFDCSDSRENDHLREEREKKVIKSSNKNECRSFAKVESETKEMKKPREVSRDSCKTEISNCRNVETETFSRFRENLVNCEDSRKIIVQPIVPRSTTNCYRETLMDETIKPSSSSSRHSQRREKFPTKSYSCSNVRSNDEIHNVHGASTETLANIENDNGQINNCLNKISRASSNFKLSLDVKNHENHISHADKIKQYCKARFHCEKSEANEKTCSGRFDNSNESGNAKITRYNLFVAGETRAKRKCCLESIKKESMKNLTLPRKINDCTNFNNNQTPKLTKTGQRCFAKSRSRISTSLAEFCNQRPNISSLKYRLSKCHELGEIWQNYDKIPAVKTAQLPKPIITLSRRRNNWNCENIIEKSFSYLDTGKWLNQRYNVRQRIYTCSRLKNSSNRAIELDPCPALIEDSEAWIERLNSVESRSSINSKQYEYIGKGKNFRNTKNYQTKMQESGGKRRIDRRKIFNRGCL